MVGISAAGSDFEACIGVRRIQLTPAAIFASSMAIIAVRWRP